MHDLGSVPPLIDFPSFDFSPNASALPQLGALTVQGDQISQTPWTWGSEGQRPGNAGRGGGPFVLCKQTKTSRFCDGQKLMCTKYFGV